MFVLLDQIEDNVYADVIGDTSHQLIPLRHLSFERLSLLLQEAGYVRVDSRENAAAFFPPVPAK
jgi:hypothetical protein